MAINIDWISYHTCAWVSWWFKAPDAIQLHWPALTFSPSWTVLSLVELHTVHTHNHLHDDLNSICNVNNVDWALAPPRP